MARPRSVSSAPRLSPGQASYVIDQLLSERRISVGEINRYLGDMHREISDLEQRLASLRNASGAAGGSASKAKANPVKARRGRPAAAGRKRGRPARTSTAATKGATKRAAKRATRRRRAVTPERLASQKLQGRYLGLIRQIPANKRAQYQKMAKERGREVAVREMAQALGK